MRRLVLALGSGGLLTLAFPTFEVWAAAPVALGLLAWATTGVGARRGFGLGFAAGLAFFLPSLQWAGTYVGAVPWIALAVLEALFIGVAGAVTGWLSRSGQVRPVAFALVWTVTEELRGVAPYGGFPWLKLAFGQADSPMGRLVALGSTPFVAFVVALVGALLASAAAAALRRMPPGRVLLPAGVALGLGAAGLAVPLPTDGRTAQVAGIQGNVPRAGLDFNAQRRQVLDNHVAATRQVAAQVAAGSRPKPDLVIWPENASDIDPIRNADAKSEILQVVDELKTPVIVGGLLEEPAPYVSNASLLYEPGRGLTDRYIKRHPVPFGEYIPNREFFRLFSDKVDLVRRDFVAGPKPGIMQVPAASGPIRVGLGICFEVAYDDIMRDVVREGANLLVIQTNNATFGFTAESPQQLAISRVRAMEFGRSVVHVSTVGQSALISPDGTARQVTSLFTSAVVGGAVPLRDAMTVATRLGPAPTWLASLALLALVGIDLVRRPTGRATRSTRRAFRRTGRVFRRTGRVPR